VVYYDSQQSLTETLTEYILTADANERCIVVTQAITIKQLVRNPEIRTRLQAGDLHFFSAEAMLEDICDASGRLSDQRFIAKIGGLIASIEQSGKKVRVYGDMVVLLWKSGARSKAIALEELWNKLSQVQSFSLLCAYPEQSIVQKNARLHIDTCHAQTFSLAAAST